MNPIYIARSPHIAESRLGDEAVVMSARDSRIFSLNEQAASIWWAADGITPLSEIVQKAIVAVYDVDLETAYADTLQFVNELAARGILTVAAQPISTA